jgi:phosphate transport system substrate-binding protein
MKNNSRIFYVVMVVILLASMLTACANKKDTTGENSSDLKGEIGISGAFALYPMMQRWAEEFNKIHPDVVFDVQAGGAGKGMSDALANQVDIGMVSRAITPEEEAKGAYWVPVTKDAVFPTISAQNPVLKELQEKGLTKEQFARLFLTEEIITWGELVGKPEITDKVHVYTRSDSCGAAETWVKFMGGQKQEELLGIGVSGDPGLLDVVSKDPLGIGYNNLNYAYDVNGDPVVGAAIIPIDKNGNGVADPEEILKTKADAVNAVATGLYPSPPARDLNLVTNGKPSGIVQEFIRWILTEGQKFVGEAGYVTLSETQLTDALAKVK